MGQGYCIKGYRLGLVTIMSTTPDSKDSKDSKNDMIAEESNTEAELQQVSESKEGDGEAKESNECIAELSNGDQESSDQDSDGNSDENSDENSDGSGSDEGDGESDDGDDDEDAEEEEDIVNLLGKRPSSAISSAGNSKRKLDSDDEEEVTFVADNLDDIETSNIIPRSKRRAALASGLVRPSSGHSSGQRIATSQFDSDDEEADF